MKEVIDEKLRTTADATFAVVDPDASGRQSGEGERVRKVVKSSNLQASFTLFKSFIGTGILALPYAFKTAGIGLSFIFTLIIGCFLTHCFLLLLETANDKSPGKRISLQSLANEVLGDKQRYFVQALLIIEQLGCCIGILIFTKDFLNHVLCVFEINHLCNNTWFNVLFALTLTAPLSLINNMHYFYLPSLAANFFIIVGLSAQTYYNIETIHNNPSIHDNFVNTFGSFHITNLPLFFGVALYSFEGVGVTLSIRDSMEKPQDLPKLLKGQMAILTVIYIIFSALTCLAFGTSIPEIVFFSLPAENPVYLLIQILYAISVLLSYPIQLFPAIRIMENSSFLKDKLFFENGSNKNRLLRYGLRFMVIGIVFLVAYLTKSFHLFLNLLGSCVFTLLGFGIPIWLYMTQFKGRVAKRTKIANYVILAVTAVFGGFGFVTSITGLVNAGKN